MSINTFVHRYIPASQPKAPTLLLLHGTGGTEESLLELGAQLAPGAGLLSPRGKVLENGNPRFFRRLAEGVFDQEDLLARTHELGDFIEATAAHYGFATSSLIAVGYSNGANVAASLMLLRPGLVLRGVFFRSMLPFEPDPLPKLAGTSALLLSGRYDNLMPIASVERLAELLEQSGAQVTLNWQPTDHRLTNNDFVAAQEWISQQMVKTQSE